MKQGTQVSLAAMLILFGCFTEAVSTAFYARSTDRIFDNLRPMVKGWTWEGLAVGNLIAGVVAMVASVAITLPSHPTEPAIDRGSRE